MNDLWPQYYGYSDNDGNNIQLDSIGVPIEYYYLTPAEKNKFSKKIFKAIKSHGFTPES